MVVQHNLQAMNSNRMLGITQGSLSKSTEKLSSGYKINRAADDAAGLSISEKMRKQIRGLTQASLNAEDGISAVQTAEGALNEVQDMLQRMNELAVKAANGTNSEDDRNYIQDEIEQLQTEIDRVAETTKFNETYLLKGTGDFETKTLAAQDAGFAGTMAVGEDGESTFTLEPLAVGDTIKIAGKDYTIAESANTSDYSDATMAQGAGADGTTALIEGDKIIKADGTVTEIKTGNKGTATLDVGDTFVSAATGKRTTIVKAGYTPTKLATVEAAIKGAASDTIIKIDNVTYKLGTTTDGTTITADDLVTKLQHGQSVDVDGTTYTVIAEDPADKSEISLNTAYDMIAKELTAASSIGADVQATVKNVGDGSFRITQGTVEVKEALSFNLHVGADADTTNKISLSIDSVGAAGLGIKGINVADCTGTAATYAVDVIANAIQQISKQRSALGAVQNRLEHTINNLDNVVENTTAAESQIRDTDMATEMVKYSNNNILAQAGQAMLAQANQANQGVLSLLQ